MVRGATVSFLLGYLLDGFSGNLMSLQTFILVATSVLAVSQVCVSFCAVQHFSALTFGVALVTEARSSRYRLFLRNHPISRWKRHGRRRRCCARPRRARRFRSSCSEAEL